MLDVGRCLLCPDPSIRGRALLCSWTSVAGYSTSCPVLIRTPWRWETLPLLQFKWDHIVVCSIQFVHYLYIADLMEYHANVRWWCVTTCDRRASLSSWFLKAAGLSCSTTTGSWFQSWWSAMIGGCRAQQTSMERLNRLREANGPTANGREFQSVMVRGMNEYLKASVRTGSDIHLFSLEALVCRDETERWSREMAERLLNAL